MKVTHLETTPDDEVQIIVRCTRQERERIKAKAAAVKTSMNDYVLRSTLRDERYRDADLSAVLMPIYVQLREINLRLKAMQTPSIPLLKRVIAVVQKVQGEVAMYQLARRVQEFLIDER